MKPRHLVLHSGMPGHTELMGFRFDPLKPYCGCRICGEVYQSEMDRTATTPAEQYAAFELRVDWQFKHAKLHPERQHRALAVSGLWATPEAAQKLASFGVIALSDTVKHDEFQHALFESPRSPADDAQGC